MPGQPSGSAWQVWREHMNHSGGGTSSGISNHVSEMRDRFLHWADTGETRSVVDMKVGSNRPGASITCL